MSSEVANINLHAFLVFLGLFPTMKVTQLVCSESKDIFLLISLQCRATARFYARVSAALTGPRWRRFVALAAGVMSALGPAAS